MAHRFLPLSTVLRFVPLARYLGVSEVARSPRGFLSAYRRAGGKAEDLSPAWRAKREAFISRHLGQLEARGEALYSDRAMTTPTRRHLALIMWAYSPVKGQP